jgi:hypothetical protein
VNIGLIIAQLKTSAPLFAGNVAGAAEYERAVEDQTWLPLPAAYVIPLDTEAGPNDSMNGLFQVCTERIGIIVAMDNSADRRGQAPVATIDRVQAALFRAVLNWRPDSSIDNPGQPAGNPQLDHETRGFRLDHANLVGWDRARLFYQWDFALDVTITDADGWQQPPFAPLTTLDIHVDTVQPVDRFGTYPAPTAPPYTPAPAPRTEGPDGRDEGALTIPLEGG